MPIKSILLTTLYCCIVIAGHAQGCSDAGFCTLSSFKPQVADSSAQSFDNQVKVGLSYGQADHDITVLAGYLEYDRQFGRGWGMDLKLTGLSQSGNDISVSGPSDIFLNAHYATPHRARIILGGKIPLTSGNRKENGVALPMDYQSSLGTFDLVVGLACEVKKLQLVLALQQPLTQNDNEFIVERHALDSPLRQFQTTNQFQRRGDLLLRIAYPFALGPRLRITPSLLPIYHLGTDRYTSFLGTEHDIEGSDGLTLNATAYIDYTIGRHSAVQINAGFPLVVREVRPDGLTRSLVATLEYRRRF